MTFELPWVIAMSIGSTLFGMGGAYASLRGRVAENKERIKQLEVEADEHEKADAEIHTDMIDRLARIETKIDIIVGGK